MSITLVSIADASAGTSADLSTLDDEQLQDEIRGLASLTAAAMCRLLLAVAELDRREAWGGWGVRSCAHWLSWQCGFSLPTAREHVRVARVLPALHRTVELFSRGELTYAKVRAITRVGTPENEELLVGYAQEATASQLEHIVRAVRRAGETEEANRAHDARALKWTDRGDGIHVLTITMTTEERVIIEKALVQAEKEVSAETRDAHRPVEALTSIARSRSTCLVNLNVSMETLSRDADGECSLEGQDIAVETARRLSCDAPVVATLLSKEGATLRTGRRKRLFTGAVRSAVLRRDRGICAFPSCTHTRWIDVHHITHWANGGLTEVDNGVVLCGFHHRLVHEGGFSVDHTLTFRTPSGRVITANGGPLKLVTGNALTVSQAACISGGNGQKFDLGVVVGSLMEAAG